MKDGNKTRSKRISTASNPRQRRSPLPSSKKISETPKETFRRQSGELSALRLLALRMSAGLSLGQVAATALREIGKIVSPDAAVFYLRLGDNLHLRASLPGSKKLAGIGKGTHQVGECLCGAAGKGKPVYSKNIFIDRRCTLRECKEAGVHSFAALPLVSQKGILGVIGLASLTERDFSTQAAFLEALAGQVAIALRNALMLGQEARRNKELRQIAANLRKSEGALAVFRTLIDQTNDAIFVSDPETSNILYVNEKACMNLSYRAEELLGMRVVDISVHAQTMDVWRAGVRKIRKEGSGVIKTEHKKKDGSTIPVEINVRCVRHAGSEYIVSVARDITERKQAERDRTRLANIIERSLNEIYMFDAETLRFRYVNTGALRNLGYSRAEIESMTPLDLKPEFTEKSFRAFIGPLLAHEKDKEVFQTVHRRADGSLYPVEVHLQLVEQDQERMFLAVIIDITERRRAEEEKQKLQTQLLQAQKMEAVGQLAGGIAHDFNNILTAIIGYGNVVLMQAPEDGPVRHYIDQILSSAERAAGLTQGLLAFSRKQIINPQPVSMNAVIERVEKLLRRIIGEDIELRTTLTPDDTSVLADTGQLEQILMNLAANARDAMPGGGRLTIETGIAEIDESYIRSHGYGKQGTYVLTSVTDTGVGMDEETRRRIFEPFFTTKEVGKGTGLGLSIVYGSVKQHDGYINVYSEPGRGTTFKMYLPLLKSEAKASVSSGPPPPPAGGDETILLAEDDPTLRNLARDVLEGFGYRVIAAADGEDAIERLKEHRDRVRLLLVDVIMPKKNGKQVYEEARRIAPGIKCMFISGYPANVIQQQGVLEEGLTFITKPLPPQELLRKVREVLDA